MLSVYLALEQTAVVACETQLRTIADGLPPSFELSVTSRIGDVLRTLPTFAHGTRAVVLFFSVDGSELASQPLPERVAPMVVFDAHPWLEPLLSMCCPGDPGVALAGWRSARPGQQAPAAAPTVSSDRLEASTCP